MRISSCEILAFGEICKVHGDERSSVNSKSKARILEGFCVLCVTFLVCCNMFANQFNLKLPRQLFVNVFVFFSPFTAVFTYSRLLKLFTSVAGSIKHGRQRWKSHTR